MGEILVDCVQVDYIVQCNALDISHSDVSLSGGVSHNDAS